MSVSPAKPMSPGVVVLLLALLLGIQPITTDLYLPALPALTTELGARISQGQLTLTALLLCFGVSQLFFGPLSDRFGRRPVLLGGVALYTLAGIGNMLASSIEWLIVTRAVQGAAMGAAVMCARAIIRDLYAPAEGARVMARALGGLGIIACLSPLAGGVLVPLVGWRWALGMLALFGLALLVLLALRFAETLRQPTPLQFGPLMRNWGRIASHRGFIAWAGLLAAAYGGLFTFLAASSFVFLDVYRVSRPMYGLAMASASLAYILGTFACRRLLPRVGLQGAVRVGAALSLAGGTGMGLLAMAGVHTWWGAWPGPLRRARRRLRMAMARALAGGDHQRRLGPGLPRHGHRHRQAHAGRTRRRAAPPDRHPRPAAGLLGGRIRRRRARLAAEIRARGRLPLLVGGTMLYFKALREGPGRHARSRRRRARAAGRRGARQGLAGAARRAGARGPGHRGAAGPQRRAAHPARAGGLAAQRPAAVEPGMQRGPACPDAARIVARWWRWSPASAAGCTRASRALRRHARGCGLVDEVRRLRARGDLHARPAGDALRGLPAGLGGAGCGRRGQNTLRLAVTRRAGRLRPRRRRHAPAGQAPADLAARHARGTVLACDAPDVRRGIRCCALVGAP
jgi:DHA1 family bicyclomycin/chloramphenicol resistance-like MFS transporter